MWVIAVTYKDFTLGSGWLGDMIVPESGTDGWASWAPGGGVGAASPHTPISPMPGTEGVSGTAWRRHVT